MSETLISSMKPLNTLVPLAPQAKKQDQAGKGSPQDATFYSSVISHSYYAIFYAAKAIF